MKIFVYAIAKNESSNYKRWLESVKEADGILVLDTGSTSIYHEGETLADAARELMCQVSWFAESKHRPGPFDFAAARNEALALAQEQFTVAPGEQAFFVSLDLDEVIEPGWKFALEELLGAEENEFVNQIVFRMHVPGDNSYDFDVVRGSRKFTHEWKYPIHEVLTVRANERQARLETGINVYHYPDDNKERDYLPSCLQMVTQYPNDPRSYHYFGRELMMRGDHTAALSAFETYLSFEYSHYVWKAEIAIILNYMGFCHEQLGQAQAAEMAYMRAITYAPNCREPYLDLSDFYSRYNDNTSAYALLCRALTLPETNEYIYKKPAAYSEFPHHMACAIAWRLGFKQKSKWHIEEALKLAKNPSAVLLADYKFFHPT